MPPRKSRSGKRPRRRGSRTAKRPREERHGHFKAVIDPGPDAHETLSAPELYRLEKARRKADGPPNAAVLQAAHREYRALLAADAAKGKGGRPRKNAPRAKPSARGEPDVAVRDTDDDDVVEPMDDASEDAGADDTE